MDRTSSMGLWTYAKSYLDAGYAVATSVPRALAPIPAYYLYCHAIELALKAYLRGTGASITEIKRIGHDLSKAYKKALSIGLNDIYELTPEQIEAINLANPIYSKKEFEYIMAGFKTLPNINVLQGTAGSLIGGIRQFCNEKRNIHN
ncbi:MAG: hypothetical protein OHK0028_07770 [Deltaproteobacteria bacterium]